MARSGDSRPARASGQSRATPFRIAGWPASSNSPNGSASGARPVISRVLRAGCVMTEGESLLPAPAHKKRPLREQRPFPRLDDPSSVELVPCSQQVARMQFLGIPVVDLGATERANVFARDVDRFEADLELVVDVVADVQVDLVERVVVRRIAESAAIRLVEILVAPVVRQACGQS